MIKVRKANKNDFGDYWELQKEFMVDNNKTERIEDFKYSLNKKLIKKNFLKRVKSKDYIYFFLEEDNNAVGFLVGEVENNQEYGYIHKAAKFGYIQNIFIVEKYRGKGYARLLINKFSKFLKKRKIKICTLHTDSYNKSAIRAYKKIGFKGPIQYKFFKRI